MLPTRTKGFEERFAGRIRFDAVAMLLKRRANRLAHLAVVVHHEDDGRSLTAGRGGGT